MSLANEDVPAALDRLAELYAAATPGPWRYNPRKEWHTDEEMLARARAGKLTFDGEEFVGAGPLDATVCVAATGPADDPQSMSDAALIVAAVNALPRLIAAIRAAYGLAEEFTGAAEPSVLNEFDRGLAACYRATGYKLRAALNEALEVPGA